MRHLTVMEIEKKVSLNEVFKIKVPENFDYDKQLDRYGEEIRPINADTFSNSSIPKGTDQIEPGKTYIASTYFCKGTITFAECLDFCLEKKGLLFGPRGLFLIRQYQPEKIPFGIWTTCLDKEENFLHGKKAVGIDFFSYLCDEIGYLVPGIQRFLNPSCDPNNLESYNHYWEEDKIPQYFYRDSFEYFREEIPFPHQAFFLFHEK